MSPYAKRPIDYITPGLAKSIYQSLISTNSLTTANTFVSVWGRIYSYALDQEWLKINPFSFVQKTRAKPRDNVWTNQQVMAVVNAAMEGKDFPVAKGLMLMYDTAQRPSDVLNMTYSMVEKDDNGYFIKFRQSKTGVLALPAITEYTATLLGLPVVSDVSARLVGCRMVLSVFLCHIVSDNRMSFGCGRSLTHTDNEAVVGFSNLTKLDIK